MQNEINLTAEVKKSIDNIVAAYRKENDTLSDAIGDGKPCLVYVVSKLRGDLSKNIKYAAYFSREVATKSTKETLCIPVASHIMYPAMGFNDWLPNVRLLCRIYGLYLLSKCDKVHVFTINNEISEGMKEEIRVAEKLNMPIEYTNYESEFIN